MCGAGWDEHTGLAGLIRHIFVPSHKELTIHSKQAALQSRRNRVYCTIIIVMVTAMVMVMVMVVVVAMMTAMVMGMGMMVVMGMVMGMMEITYTK